MRYLVSVIDHETGSATAAEMAAIDAYNGRLHAAGHWVLAGGLEPPSKATVIDNRGAVAVLTAGPFVDSTQYMAGFWIIEAPSPDVALELASDASKACNRQVEVRPFLGG